jgi:polyhydroxybutyrate depolymerase
MNRVRPIVFGFALAASLAAAVVVVAGTGSSGTAASSRMCRPGDRMLSYSVDGNRHQALLHVPRGVRGRVPLVLAFHGAYSDPRGTATYYGLSRPADRDHFAVLYPQASHDKFWQLRREQGEDVEAVGVLLDRVERASCIDRSRVYATGVSNGGGFTARLGCELADRIAAIAPVAGGYAPPSRCHPARPLPVLEVHGRSDDVVPYGGKPVDRSGTLPSFISVARFLREWAALDGCRGAPAQTTPRPGVTRLRWDRCTGGAVVEHLMLADTEHGWPGGKDQRGDPTGVKAAEEVWSFLSRFRLPSGRS